MSEFFDNYGLRVIISADYQYDEGRKVGQFQEQLADPALEEVLESILCMIEGCWGWGASRLEVIERIKAELDEIGKEYKPGRYKTPNEFAELDANDPFVFRSKP